MSRFVSWFSTKNGRTFTHYCIGAAALTVFGVKSAIHGPFLDKMKQVIQIYKKGEPKPLSPGLNQMVKEVLQDSNLKREEKKKIQFFYVVGHEPFHGGGINSPWGAIVGVPFFFDDMKEFKINDLRLKGKETLDWIIDGHDLLESLAISENAKKFAFLRGIYSCNIVDVLSNAFIAASCIILPATYLKKINLASQAFERLTVKKRCFRYAVIYFGGFILYRLLKDPLKHLSEQKADQLAAETGPEYLDGGIEFYEKTLMKNKALEELLKSRFRKTYDENGNENYFLLAPKLPLTKRLENLQKMKKEKAINVEKDKLE